MRERASRAIARDRAPRKSARLARRGTRAERAHTRLLVAKRLHLRLGLREIVGAAAARRLGLRDIDVDRRELVVQLGDLVVELLHLGVELLLVRLVALLHLLILRLGVAGRAVLLGILRRLGLRCRRGRSRRSLFLSHAGCYVRRRPLAQKHTSRASPSTAGLTPCDRPKVDRRLRSSTPLGQSTQKDCRPSKTSALSKDDLQQQQQQQQQHTRRGLCAARWRISPAPSGATSSTSRSR